MVSRRLLFFFDGSSNKAAAPTDIVPTNVFRLNRALTYGFSGVPQIVFYFAGVGTRRDYTSAATGRGFDEIVIEAYVNLACNYMPNDQVYLFGFSRGAAAARALSGLISTPGLLPADHLDAFPELWKCFIDRKLSRAKREQVFLKFKDRLTSPQPTIKFLGAFDTVAGSSWDRFNLFGKVRFNNLDLDKSVEHAVQILAIDDDRIPSFSPLVWERSGQGQVLEQIWMPGVHADIGGCSDGRFLGDVALLTMIERIRKHCPELEFDDETYLQKELLPNIRSADCIEITYERPGLLRKLLRRGFRVIGQRKSEYIHPISNFLINRRFTIKGAQKQYKPENNCESLPVLGTEMDSELEDICKRLTMPM